MIHANSKNRKMKDSKIRVTIYYDYLFYINFRKLPTNNSLSKLTSHEECLDIPFISGKCLYYKVFKNRVNLLFENLSSYINSNL